MLLILTTAMTLLSGVVQTMPSPPSSSGSPPTLPQYYSRKQPTPTQGATSLVPTSPIFVAQRLRSSNDDNDSGGSSYASDDYDDASKNSGFVEPIDFSGLLKDVASSPKVPSLDIGNERSNNPLFTSESKDTFQGFFGSKKDPFAEFSRLNSASSNLNSRQHSGGDENNDGFVDPNVQFRSLFDSSPTVGFQPEDFLGSSGSQTRAFPSFTYSGRQSGGGDDDYSEAGPASNNEPDYYRSNNGGYRGNNDELYNQGASPYGNNRERDAYSNPSRSHSQNNRNYGTVPNPRYSQPARETSSSPQSQQKEASSSSNPRCKRVEKNVEYGDDHSSFTDPEPDYDPSSYRGRYKRQTRQRARTLKRPMICFVCEDERGRYAEKCSFDSNSSPRDKQGNYFHAESSSFSDNGRG